jgi:hypothetical protein
MSYVCGRVQGEHGVVHSLHMRTVLFITQSAPKLSFIGVAHFQQHTLRCPYSQLPVLRSVTITLITLTMTPTVTKALAKLQRALFLSVIQFKGMHVNFDFVISQGR